MGGPGGPRGLSGSQRIQQRRQQGGGWQERRPGAGRVGPPGDHGGARRFPKQSQAEWDDHTQNEADTMVHYHKSFGVMQEIWDHRDFTTLGESLHACAALHAQYGVSQCRFMDIGCAPGGFSSCLLQDHILGCNSIGWGVSLPPEMGGFAMAFQSDRFAVQLMDIMPLQSTDLLAPDNSVDLVCADAQYLKNMFKQRSLNVMYRGVHVRSKTLGIWALTVKECQLAFSKLHHSGTFIFRFGWRGVGDAEFHPSGEKVEQALLSKYMEEEEWYKALTHWLFSVLKSLFETLRPFKSEYVHQADVSFYQVCRNFNRDKYERYNWAARLQRAFEELIQADDVAALVAGLKNSISDSVIAEIDELLDYVGRMRALGIQSRKVTNPTQFNAKFGTQAQGESSSSKEAKGSNAPTLDVGTTDHCSGGPPHDQAPPPETGAPVDGTCGGGGDGAAAAPAGARSKASDAADPDLLGEAPGPRDPASEGPATQPAAAESPHEGGEAPGGGAPKASDAADPDLLGEAPGPRDPASEGLAMQPAAPRQPHESGETPGEAAASESAPRAGSARDSQPPAEPGDEPKGQGPQRSIRLADAVLGHSARHPATVAPATVAPATVAPATVRLATAAPAQYSEEDVHSAYLRQMHVQNFQSQLQERHMEQQALLMQQQVHISQQRSLHVQTVHNQLHGQVFFEPPPPQWDPTVPPEPPPEAMSSWAQPPAQHAEPTAQVLADPSAMAVDAPGSSPEQPALERPAWADCVGMAEEPACWAQEAGACEPEPPTAAAPPAQEAAESRRSRTEVGAGAGDEAAAAAPVAQAGAEDADATRRVADRALEQAAARRRADQARGGFADLDIAAGSARRSLDSGGGASAPLAVAASAATTADSPRGEPPLRRGSENRARSPDEGRRRAGRGAKEAAARKGRHPTIYPRTVKDSALRVGKLTWKRRLRMWFDDYRRDVQCGGFYLHAVRFGLVCTMAWSLRGIVVSVVSHLSREPAQDAPGEMH
ncbi:unnamed protein product [Prorocentrum cordatum]|uniref:Ribosomal RNA methyltransferase FtsJ domain-containing protein n=1 Tax=Prorocentrum cordatum TaxID=2364126 RepID=A0ABN9RPI5_9DINO|nr:unnamed protein product [Polarella glacialis]